MPQCHRCQRDLSWSFTVTVGGPDNPDAWHMENPAPHAAPPCDGSTRMVPVCNKCSPMWVDPPKCEHETWMTFDMLPAAYNCAQCHVRGVRLADGRIVPDSSGDAITMADIERARKWLDRR